MSQKARYIRYLVLLLVLLAVAVNEMWVKLRVASWDETLQVNLYAFNGDARPATDDYIDQLGLSSFSAIETFVNNEARRYNIPINVINVSYAGKLFELPPQPPIDGSILENVFWSLHFRAWTWYWENTSGADEADINLFVNYFDPVTTQALHHSVGLRGGMIGLINAFADKSYQGSNNVVITHELMHTFGASDKYGSGSLPIHPSGYADPFQDPLYPQLRAEIMGGRIPVNGSQSIMPESLTDVVVNVFTATELHWPVQ